MRIVQLANFWTPTSGGLRTVVDRLAAGYAERGHRVLQVVPGERDEHRPTEWGRRVTVSSPLLPGGGGYRVIVRLRHVQRLIAGHAADVVEVSDRATLAHLATRLRGRAPRTVLVAHERLDHIVPAGAYRAAERVVRPVADRWNPRCWRGVDEIVAPSRFAADEWHRVGIVPTVVPWGVDLDVFRPGPGARAIGGPHLCWVGRLAPEKRPGLAIDALASLVADGVPAELTIVGDGPLRHELEVAARGLPVRFAGHVPDPRVVARHLGRSTVTLSTSGIETFGLSVLESLACGTPVVAVEGGAAAEVAGAGGRICAPDAGAVAAAVQTLIESPIAVQTARRRAEHFTWDRAVDAMLAVHDPARMAA